MEGDLKLVLHTRRDHIERLIDRRTSIYARGGLMVEKEKKKTGKKEESRRETREIEWQRSWSENIYLNVKKQNITARNTPSSTSPTHPNPAYSSS
jgi:spore cortex formation protein SpoVR/YcgB (stage V sporulation)